MRRSGLSFALCLALLTVVLPGCSSGSSDTEGAVRPDDKGTAKAGDGNLKTEDLKVGTGKTAEAGDYAVVHYTGWLTDGTKFDSSVDRQQPYRFRIGKDNVIRGWHLGVE